MIYQLRHFVDMSLLRPSFERRMERNDCFPIRPSNWVGGLDGKEPAEFSSGAFGSTSACAARFLPDYTSARKGIHTSRPF